MISPLQEKAKKFATKYGYKLRKIKEGRVKVTRPDGSQEVVHDFVSAHQLMMSEVFEVNPNKTIFDIDR